MSDQEIGEILRRSRVVAVVGLSGDPGRPSFQVAAYLQRHGYRVVPVNPFVWEVLGERSYGSLVEVPVELQRVLDVVDVFRRSADVPGVVADVVRVREAVGRPFVVWMQLGVVSVEAAEVARRAGLVVVMDRCMMEEHRRLGLG